MRLTAKLAKSQLVVNRRRSLWTLAGIVLSTAILSAVYGLGFGTGMDFVDQMWGDSPWIGQYHTMIYALAAIMSVFIIGIAIIVVSNAFRVSATERFSQFGILKSVGATKKQIVETIVYEGLYLTVIGVPLGLLIGIGLQGGAILVINHFFYGIDPSGDIAFLRFVFSSFALFLSVGVSMLTVFLSAWLPARKASNVPAINAIRGIGVVKVKNKKLALARLISRIFKTEGLLAFTFLKRSTANFRATVLAITFSVILVIATGSVFLQMNRVMDMEWGGSSANAVVQLTQWRQHVENEDGIWELLPLEGAMTLDEAHDITRQLRAGLNDDESVFSLGFVYPESLQVPEGMATAEALDFLGQRSLGEILSWHATIQQLVVDPAIHAKLAEIAGVPANSNILLNHAWDRIDNARFSLIPFNFEGQTLYSDTVEELTLHGQLLEADIPLELFSYLNMGAINVLVPNTDNIERFMWYGEVDDPQAFADKGQDLLSYWSNPIGGINVFNLNRQAAVESNQNMVSLMMVLTFSFVALLVTVALTNIISTLTENVRTRSKEFAVLQSVGMTPSGIKRMLGMEAVLGSIQSLTLGLPLGTLAAFGLHHALGMNWSMPFQIPWLPMAVAIIGVFAITWLTMNVAAKKLRGNNIIETIRQGSGM